MAEDRVLTTADLERLFCRRGRKPKISKAGLRLLAPAGRHRAVLLYTRGGACQVLLLLEPVDLPYGSLVECVVEVEEAEFAALPTVSQVLAGQTED